MEPVKLRMGRISYINASPVYYGLDHGLAPPWLTLVTDVPAALNRLITRGRIDLGPISAAHYAMNCRDLLLLPDLSISCHGPVMSVLCASDLPLDELTGKTVMFSEESATAAAFLKMIFARQKVYPDFKTGSVGDINTIPAGVDAVLVIGDAALTQPWLQRFSHCFDLGQIWYEMTGMPFVFAVWVVRRDVAAACPETVARALDLLKASRKAGYSNLDEVIAAGMKKLNLSRSVVTQYYDRLYCDLDSAKIDAMARFFETLYQQKILASRVEISFFKNSGGRDERI
ncbi:MAG: menaquinone biosynthesis protein [Desulfotignum sp.]|nr:menaquinone biosynthesis protein [Desulfotignum sp.]